MVIEKGLLQVQSVGLMTRVVIDYTKSGKFYSPRRKTKLKSRTTFSRMASQTEAS